MYEGVAESRPERDWLTTKDYWIWTTRCAATSLRTCSPPGPTTAGNRGPKQLMPSAEASLKSSEKRAKPLLSHFKQQSLGARAFSSQ